MSKRYFFLLSASCLCLLSSPILAGEKDPQAVAVETAKKLDTDKDGLITQAEFMNQHADPALWQQLDKDKDGVLNAGEQRQGFTPRYQIRP